MKKSESSTRNMYQLLLNLLVIFTPVWTAFAAFSTFVTSFRDKVGEIDHTAEKQQNSLKMYTANKRQKKRDMANKALVTRGKIAAFSKATGDIILLGKMKIAFFRMYYFKDTIAYGNAEIIYEAATAMTPAQRTAYDITDPELTALRDAIDTFKDLPSPVQMRVVRKQLTALLPELFKEGNSLLTDGLDGMMHEFRVSNPDFYQQWFNARRILETHRHTTIEVETFDATTGEDLSNVLVIISSDDETFEEMTDIQGFAKQQISPEINYKVKFILPEYDEKEIDGVNLNRGKHQRLIVKLKKSNA